MLLFRSEKNIENWCINNNISHGYSMSLDTCMDLARIWYHDRLDPQWDRYTKEESKKVFSEIGLTGSFWKL